MPYQALEKKIKKKGKGPKDGPCCKGSSDVVSGETEVVSSHEEDEDEEEEEEEVESDFPRKTRRGRRAASENLEGVMPKKGRVVLSDSSDSESEHSPKRIQSEKPLPEM